MVFRGVLGLLAVTLLVALVTATPSVENDLEKVHSDEVVKRVTVSKRKPRLLNVPNKIRPFCLKVVGTVQRGPRICKSISGFVVDAANSACRESCREICRWAVGTTYGCEGIIDKICPNRATLKKKIRKNVKNFCERRVQKVVSQFGRIASAVDKEIVCDQFVEAVRLTCHDSITEYCGSFNGMFQNPCTSFLPNIVCN